MELIPVALVGLCVASIALNLFLFHLRKTTKKKPSLDLTAEELLHDLTGRGFAILKVSVVDPSGLLLRSPRT